MSLFKLIDAFLGLLPSRLGPLEIPKLEVPKKLKEFFGEDAFSFDKVEALAAFSNGVECADEEYETRFLLDVTSSKCDWNRDVFTKLHSDESFGLKSTQLN